MKAKPIQTEYRKIAKVFASGLPIEGQEFGQKVNEFLTVIKQLQPEVRVALKAAYVFASKVPKEEREDMFQDLTLALLERKTKDERLAYSIARFDWIDWWRKYKVRSHFGLSLESTVKDQDGNETYLRELLVGECEFERKLDGKLDGDRLWAKLPKAIQLVVQRRLEGRALNKAEQKRLERFVHGNPMLLVAS